MRQSKRLSRIATSNAPATPAEQNAPGLLARAIDRLMGRDRKYEFTRARGGLFEPLESRRLLTTLVAGDIFQFESFDWSSFGDDPLDPPTIPVEVRVNGGADLQVQLIGAVPTLTGSRLIDLSGNVFGPNARQIGAGYGGTQGLLPLVPDDLTFISELGGIQPLNIADHPNFGGIYGGFAGPLLAPGGPIEYQALAANNRGQTYGINLVTFINPFTEEDVRQLQINQFNLDTENLTPRTQAGGGFSHIGDAVFLDNIIDNVFDFFRTVFPFGISSTEIQEGLDWDPNDPDLIESRRNDMISVFGADFAPGDDDRLYLGLNINTRLPTAFGNPDPTDVVAPFLVSVDLTTLGPSPSFQYHGGFFRGDENLDSQTVAQLQAFTIDQNDGSFVFFGTINERLGEGTQLQRIESTTGLFRANLGQFGIIQRPSVTPVIFGADQVDTVSALEHIPGEDDVGIVYAITEPDADAFLFRIRVEDGQTELRGSLSDGTQRGQDVLAFTYNPVIDSPFGLEPGGFLMFDNTTDHLLHLDSSIRQGPIVLYSIVVTGSDASSSIIIGGLDETDFTPLGLSGSAGGVATLPFDGELETVELPDDSGPLYLGLKFDLETPAGVVVFTVPQISPDQHNLSAGDYPGPLYNGMVRPGLYVLDGDMGRFQFGGTVTGHVLIQGSIDTFVAGAILTGDAGMNASGGIPFVPGFWQIDNFAVFGDARTIASATSIGDVMIEGATDSGNDSVEEIYSSRPDFAIGGRLGQLRAGGSILAAIDVRGDRLIPGVAPKVPWFSTLTGPFSGLENQATDDEAGAMFMQGRPVITAFNNDDFASYEPIGTLIDGTAVINGRLDSSRTEGPQDWVDYYGLGVMAGQEVAVRLTGPGGSPLGIMNVGVFDPDGRLIATDYSLNDQTYNQIHGQWFRFTATTAGIYRIAVAFSGDVGFDGPGGDLWPLPLVDEAYTLHIANAGNVAIGGIKAEQRIVADSVTVGTGDVIRLFRGDLGIIEARNETLWGSNTVRVLTGNLRAMQGSSLGYYDPETDAINSVHVRVPKASIGRLSATGVGGDPFGGDVFFNFFGTLDSFNRPILAEVVGDDIQNVRAVRDVLGHFITGRGIGSIVAGRDFHAPIAPTNGSIIVNADDIGDDGFVDMVSVGRHFGASAGDDGEVFFTAGGPAVDVGTNGNFRYLDIGDGAVMVRDPLFGPPRIPPQQGWVTLEAGQTFTFTDDSGTRLRLHPIPLEQDVSFNPDAPGGGLINPGTIEIRTYPVRSGGAILSNVRTDRGLRVVSLDRGPRATAEIGNITLTGEGRPLVNAVDPNNTHAGPQFVLANTFFDPNDPLGQLDPFDDIEVLLEGGNIDVFSIGAAGTGANLGKLTRVVNSSSGEILNMSVASVGSIHGQRIGIAKPRGYADIDAATIRSNVYPFRQQPYLIGVEGSVIEIRADEVGNVWVGQSQGLGNITGGDPGGGNGGGGGVGGGGGGGGGVGGGGGGGGGVGGGGGGGNGGPGGSGPGGAFLVGGVGDGIGGGAAGGGGVGGVGLERLGEIRGRIDRVISFSSRDTRAERHQGIAAPIVASTPDTDEVAGEIRYVDIGEGILSSGSGDVGFSGLYAEGFILTVDGVVPGADIRGDIMAGEINQIRLNDGSILDAKIFAAFAGPSPGVQDFSMIRDIDNRRGSFEVGDLLGQAFFEIDRITLNGHGGIMGSEIFAPDIDRVTVNNGFGIFRTEITTTDNGVIRHVSTDGFGIRGAHIGGGRDVAQVLARGDAELLNVRHFTPSVDHAAHGLEFDPYSGRILSPANDLRLALGLPTDIDPIRRRLTNSGVIENIRVTGDRNLGEMRAQVIRSNLDSFNATTRFEDTANGIGQGQPDSDLLVNSVDFGQTVGTIAARSTYGFRVTAGDLNRVALSQDMLNTHLRISGRIDQVIVNELISGDSVIRADGPDGIINRVQAQDVFGQVRADVVLRELIVDRDLGGIDGWPRVQGSPVTVNESNPTVRSIGRIDRITVGRDVLTGSYIRANEFIDELTVGRDIQSGAVVQAAAINNLNVGRHIFGDIVLS